MPVASAVRTRLEKAAADNGFDLDLPAQGDWLVFASSHAPLRIWLTAHGETILLVALSQPSVAKALGDHGAPFANPLPQGACAARGVSDFAALHRLLRRAFLLSRTLPDALWKTFAEKAAGLPRTTEAERLVVQRVGQGIFRDGLLDYWEGRCAITGLAVPALLRASHIKPWAACDRDEDRLDVFNGLLLSANLDAAFDGGLITVADDGGVRVSEALDAEARGLLGLAGVVRLRSIAEGHRGYLAWHRANMFGVAG
jgi:putative restriction endonuclease